MKTCTKCGEEKDFSAFMKRTRHTLDGLAHACRLCENAYWREYYVKHKARKQYQGRLGQGKVQAKRAGYAPLKLSADELKYFIESHSGVCDFPLCAAPAKHIDHCHKTGKLRGYLCGGHNMALGLFHDSVEELVNAVFYLEHHR
jgi:hypothetical protein